MLHIQECIFRLGSPTLKTIDKDTTIAIGKGAVVGAGSIVTKDIPPYQGWAGNPAKYIRDRVH